MKMKQQNTHVSSNNVNYQTISEKTYKKVPSNNGFLRELAISLFKDKKNYSVYQIAMIIRICYTTVKRWIDQYEKIGLQALEPKKRGRKLGTGRFLTPAQEEKIKYNITNFLPESFKLNYSTWTRKAIAELVNDLFGVVIAVRTIGDYLKRWGFTPQKPTKMAYQRDETKVEEWTNTTFPQIKKQAEEEGGEIHYCDESGIYTEQCNAKSYSPKGKTPEIKTTGSRLKMNVISSITKDGVMRYMTYSSSMNCQKFIKFMRQIINSSRGKKVFLIVDNLRVHHGKMVTEWLSHHKKQIQIFYLPAYCPDLNPDEYLNHFMKQEFQKVQQPHNMDEHQDSIQIILKKLQKNKNKIRNIFKHSKISYISSE